MKYLISESKINNIIYNFIDTTLVDYKGGWSPGWSDDRDEYDYTYEKYFSIIEGYDDDPLMTYYTKEYKVLSYSILFLSYDLVRKFNTMFDNRWKHIFVKWFQDKFPDKSVEVFDLGDLIDTRES
jgi:hypothetical protein